MKASLAKPVGWRDSAERICYLRAMPFPDPFRPHRKHGRGLGFNLHMLTWTEAQKGRRRRRRKDLDEGGVPLEPNKPRNLSGGGAAALEFDDQQ